jgi:hypothetical protein
MPSTGGGLRPGGGSSGNTSTKPGPSARINGSCTLTRGLVRCWPCNETGGQTVRDLAQGKNLTAQVGGADTLRSLWGPGPFNSLALRFDGNSYFAGPTAGLPTGSAARTTALWVKTAVDSTAGIYCYGSGSSGQLWDVLFNSGAPGAGDAGSYALTQYGYSIGCTATTYDNFWHHLVCAADGAGNIYLYLDGALQTSAGATFSTTSSTNVLVGYDGITSIFTGGVDMPMQWNRMLSAVEIRYLYANPMCCLYIPTPVYFLGPPASATRLPRNVWPTRPRKARL